MSNQNQKAKMEFIRAYLNNCKKQVAFLRVLRDSGHKEESMILCLVYIDRFAQRLYWPSESTGQNFVNSLIEYAEDPMMGLAHPLQASRAFQLIKTLQSLGTRVSEFFPGPPYELMELPDFEKRMSSHITKDQLGLLRKNLWRVTIANVAYQHLRIPAIHGFGKRGDLMIFSETSYQGHPAPDLDLLRMMKCVNSLIAEVERRSEASGQWFGNDEMVG